MHFQRMNAKWQGVSNGHPGADAHGPTRPLLTFSRSMARSSTSTRGSGSQIAMAGDAPSMSSSPSSPDVSMSVENPMLTLPSSDTLSSAAEDPSPSRPRLDPSLASVPPRIALLATASSRPAARNKSSRTSSSLFETCPRAGSVDLPPELPVLIPKSSSSSISSRFDLAADDDALVLLFDPPCFESSPYATDACEAVPNPSSKSRSSSSYLPASLDAALYDAIGGIYKLESAALHFFKSPENPLERSLKERKGNWSIIGHRQQEI